LNIFLTLHRFTLALLLMLTAATPALAQYGNSGDGDSGEYQILSARYGTAERNVDVTQRLKELARQDQRFKMGNDSFGVDPDPGRVKTLRIYARSRDGQSRTFEYGEGHHVDGSKFTGWGGGDWGNNGGSGGWEGGPGPQRPGYGGDDGEYQILQASYGTERRNVDVTQRLKELARQDRSFRMGNDTFGTDPDRGRVKTLRIYARSKASGRTRTFEYPENGIVDGSLFTGWGGGNWGHGGWDGGWGGSAAGDRDRGLNIISASYGAGSRNRDVTERLRGMVRSNRLDVRVNNSLAGTDPAPGKPKTLTLSYSLDGGRTQSVRVEENQRLRLP